MAVANTGGSAGVDADRWALWDEEDAKSVLASFLPLGVGSGQLNTPEWNAAAFEALAGMAALARQRAAVPSDLVPWTVELSAGQGGPSGGGGQAAGTPDPRLWAGRVSPAEETSEEDWWVLVQLVREHLADMHNFAAAKGGGLFPGVMEDSFLCKRARSPARGASDPGAQVSLMAGADPGGGDLTAERRAELAAREAGLRTLPHNVLVRTLETDTIPDDVGSPPRRAAQGAVLDAAGVGTRVLDDGEEGGRRVTPDAHMRRAGWACMGGVLDEQFFLHTWDNMRRMVRRPWFPCQKGKPASDHINYLELFAVWWAVALWGWQLAGRTVVVRIDNQCALTQDRDDWMPHPGLWHELDVEFGPFMLDSCVAVSRANAYCVTSWSKDEDARVQDFAGCNAWGNLPFSITEDILRKFLRCKRRQQLGTARTFLVPVWDGHPAWELVRGLPGVLKVGAGADDVVQALQQKARRYEGAALADNTTGTYNTGAKAFLTFCVFFACLGCMSPLLPATDETRIYFITFNSWFVTPSTIKTYMVGVRQLHLQRGHEWKQVAQRHRVAATQQGVRRFWGRPSKPVMPLTLRDLARMARLVDRRSLTALSVWAAILVGFFGSFRKDNFTEGKAAAWNSRASLVRGDVIFAEDGETAGDSALFIVEKVTGKKVQLVPLGHTELVKGIKALAAAVGLNPADYAGHSLSRGHGGAAVGLVSTAGQHTQLHSQVSLCRTEHGGGCTKPACPGEGTLQLWRRHGAEKQL
ncbi:hypothetical protein CYMTET_17343 [Cymbomonas tetramitiformis]|uniref:Uncharacterized protein n=1 Tax=Cymbomonas tetramitiformis TaxID=36881 RepID=A0AAE0L782_9CHLO|nr:hypothetical protein CYMTET_17343 [Cymbomonas tetramitiformis]